MPSMVIPFSIDFIVLIVFLSYLLYGYFSGTHHQLRIFLNIVFPILLLNMVAPLISTYVYVPLLQSDYFTIVATYLSAFKYTATMVTSYIIAYSGLFFIIFFGTRFIRKRFLTENINASLGKLSHYLGALIAAFNTYFLGYFLLIPLLSINLVQPSDSIATFVLNNPPPFTRTAALTQNSTKINEVLDQIYQFERLLNVTQVDAYYDASFRPLIQTVFTNPDSYESIFMDTIYGELSSSSKTLIETTYVELFGSALSPTHFGGISLVLLSDNDTEKTFETVVKQEDVHSEAILSATVLVTQYESDLIQYETDLELYEFDLEYSQFMIDSIAYYEDSVNYFYQSFKWIDAQTGFEDALLDNPPQFVLEIPTGYVYGETYENPVEPELTQAIVDAQLLVNTNLNYNNTSTQLALLGNRLAPYAPVLTWFNDHFEMMTIGDYEKSDVINEFKISDDLATSISDERLKLQLTNLKRVVTAYDFFTAWMACTITAMEELSEEELSLHSCSSIDLTAPVDYTDDTIATTAITYLFESDHILKLMDQYQRDYLVSGFQTVFANDPSTLSIVESTASFIDEFNEDYRSVAQSLDSSLSMPIRIGISIIKKHVDLTNLFKTSPMTNALLSDLSGFCVGATGSEINQSVQICNPVSGDDQLLSMALGSRYLLTQIMVNVFILIDENNDPVTYDYETTETFLKELNQLVVTQLIPVDVIKSMADQIAFAPYELGSQETLLDHLYYEGRISMEAIRLLAVDDYDLFSEEFQARARNLIR